MNRGIGRDELGSLIGSNPRLIGALRGTNMAGFLSKTELEALVAGSVQTADIADGAITNAKVAAAAAIAHNKLAAGAVRQAVIAGGAAGAHAITGIAVGDSLVSVLYLARDGGPPVDNIADLSDLTAEFTISDADEIDNTGGTATTGGYLVVTWEDRTP